MRLIHDHILRTVHGDVVLVPLSNRETDFRGMIVLNSTGEFLCKLLQRETDPATLAAALVQEYGVTLQQAERDVDAFLARLDSCHMLVH